MKEYNPYSKENFSNIINNIDNDLEKHPDLSMDISDLGNLIGSIVAKYFKKHNGKKEFISGVNHGISLVDGTHGKIL